MLRTLAMDHLNHNAHLEPCFSYELDTPLRDIFRRMEPFLFGFCSVSTIWRVTGATLTLICRYCERRVRVRCHSTVILCRKGADDRCLIFNSQCAFSNCDSSTMLTVAAPACARILID